jgi:hypothetical protein
MQPTTYNYTVNTKWTAREASLNPSTNTATAAICLDQILHLLFPANLPYQSAHTTVSSSSHSLLEKCMYEDVCVCVYVQWAQEMERGIERVNESELAMCERLQLAQGGTH